MDKIVIELADYDAEIVSNILKYQDLPKLKEAERLDPFKDNGYLINAIEHFVAAVEGAKKCSLSIAVGVINDEIELAEKAHKESKYPDELEKSLKVVKDYLQDLLDDLNQEENK